MRLFNEALQTLALAQAQQRIGRPVSLRITLLAAAEREPGMMSALIDAACRLLESTPIRVWARDTSDWTCRLVHLEFREGQTAHFTLGSAGASGTTRVEALYVGSRGIACWQPEENPLVMAVDARDFEWSRSAPDGLAPLQPVLDAIEASLASNRAIPIGDLPTPAAAPSRTPPDAHVPGASESGLAAIGASEGHTPRVAPIAVGEPVGVLLVTGGQTHQEMYGAWFKADPRCRVVGLVDEANLPERRRELDAELAKSLDIPLLDDYAAALARPDVQVVCVCAEPERRTPLILQAAAAGKHLYLDKPLCATLAETRQLAAAIATAGVANQMFSQVHSAFSTRVRRVVESGRLGTLRAVHCEAFFAKGTAGTATAAAPRREHAEPERFQLVESKRELHNVGIYPLVMLGWLFQQPVERVFATTGNYFFAEHQRDDVEDFAQLTLELGGGLLATVATGRAGWMCHPSGGLQRVTLIGDRASATIDAHRPRLEVWADEPAWTAPRPHPEDPMGFWVTTQEASGVQPKRAWLTPADDSNDARYFIDCLLAGRASDVPIVLAASTMETILAAYRSAAAGQPVMLPLG